MNSGTPTPLICKCGSEIELHCGDFILHDELDLTLECANGCGESVLNAFVKISSFQPLDDAASG